MRRSVLLAGCLGVLATGCALVASTSYAAGNAEAAPTVVTQPGSGALAAEVVRLVNVERGAAGCRPSTVDGRLARAARKHSADMAANDYFGHTGRDGSGFGTRISREGYPWYEVGENIAGGQHSPADVMTDWMNSPSHRANIQNCAFRDIGVGVAADRHGRLIWTQDFGSER